MDLGPHAAFVWSSYAVVTIAIAATIGWLVANGRRRGKELADLEARGVRRRTAPASPPPQDQ